MSVRIMSMVFESEGLESTEKLVLLALADHANDDGLSIYPSVGRIARKTALSERSVQMTIRELQKKQILQLVRNGGGHVTNEYTINIENLAELGVKVVHPRGESSSPVGVNDVHPRGESSSPESSITIIKTPINIAPAGASQSRAVETNLDEGQKRVLGTFNAKRFKNNVQRDTVKELWEQFPETFPSALTWAATRGLDMGSAIAAMKSALPTWGQNGNGHKKSAGNGSKYDPNGQPDLSKMTFDQRIDYSVRLAAECAAKR